VNSYQPLAGIRVFDLTQYVSGPWATMMLGRLGAEVIKIERPDGGDVYRRQGPDFLGEESISFLALNQNKKSVCINLAEPEGRAIGQRLLRTCDVIVQNLRPGSAERLGFGRDEVRRLAPEVIWAALSGYGGTGPKGNDGGYDLIIQGEVGLMEMTGHPDRPPAKAGVAIVDVMSGNNLVLGILAALLGGIRHGNNPPVQTSLFETGISLTTIHAERFLNLGRVPRRSGSASPLFAPYEAYRSSDGYVTVEGTGPAGAWQRFCDALGLSDLADDPRFADNASRIRNLDALRSAAEERTTGETTSHWEKAFRSRGLPCGQILNLGDALEGPQTEALQMVVDAPHTALGTYRTLRGPVRYGDADAPVVGAPLLGQHTREVLTALDVTDADLERLQAADVIYLPAPAADTPMESRP
jgi:crotonobetainyl-CoA:carnitine CoA-transferase CaiB-like acyl-CoA transferase